MKTLALLVLTLFATPQGSNPYCGTSPDSFYPMPQVNCPGPGPHLVDINCVEACADLWQTEMHLAYEAACDAYEAGYELWQAWDSVIDTAYDACMQAAQTPQDGVECYRQMLQNRENNDAAWEAQQQSIENNLAADVQAAMNTFNNCAAECCYSPLPPDEQ